MFNIQLLQYLTERRLRQEKKPMSRMQPFTTYNTRALYLAAMQRLMTHYGVEQCSDAEAAVINTNANERATPPMQLAKALWG
jgi:hypothetical protein